MRFYTLLKNGGCAKRIGEEFAKELLACSDNFDGIYNMASQFSNECFQAIGFECNISAFDIENFKYKWPTDCNIYIFPYNAIYFKKFEQFLSFLCQSLHEFQDKYMYFDAAYMEKNESPIELFTLMLAGWCNIYRCLQEQNENVAERFDEPLARINYQLLLGANKMRIDYGDDLPLLHKICDRLYRSALNGIFYDQAIDEIVNGLLQLFEENFELFFKTSPDSLNFYNEVLNVKDHYKYYYLVYRRLEQMLHRYANESKLLILTNFLITKHMQTVYFTTIKKEPKRVVNAALEFLYTLNSTVLDANCFLNPLIESILELVLKNGSRLAAKVYIAIVDKKIDNDSIMKHILEFIFSKSVPISKISNLVTILWIYFPHMRNCDLYFKILLDDNLNLNMRFSSAHFLVAVYNKMLNDFGKYKQNIEHTLNILLNNFDKIHNNTLTGILLHIFANTKLTMLKTHVINYELMLGKFEDTLAKLFLTDKHMNYPWLNNIFVELNRCLDKTANWAVLEELSIDIYKEFEFIDKQIQTLDPNNKKLYIRILESYITVLQKLNIISKTNYDLLDDEAKILHSLKMRIIDQTIMNVAEKSIKNNIDAYGVEIITSYLIKLCQKSELNLVFATELAESLEKFCLDFLQTFNNSQKIPITCVQSHFSSLINLYCELMPESNLALLTLNSESYHILLHVLIFVIFEKKGLQFEDYSNMKSKMHPIRIYEYQQIILNQFIYLHSHENLNIPSKTIWKLCIYYELPQKKFDEELKQLLQTLSLRQFNLFKYILPVIVFNLHTKRYNLSELTILKVIKKYNLLLDDLPKIMKPLLLKIHLVLTVLQMTKKSLEIFEIRSNKNNNNRLNTLNYLYIFIENIDFRTSDVVQDITTEAEKLRTHFLHSKEQQTLRKFLNVVTKSKKYSR